MIVYAESSAVLSWLLGEPREAEVRRVLAPAERVVASSLTALECARALARGAATGRLDRREQLAALQLLDMVSSSWAVLEMTGRVLDRARATFPREPIRTLDALHLASALVFHEAHGALTMLSLDEPIRANAERLGLTVQP